MQIMISLKQHQVGKDSKMLHVIVDDGQKIEGTLKVLAEAGLLISGNRPCVSVRSMRTRRRIPLGKNYREAHVYNGDILTLEE